jgi:hypothetical protein
MTTTEPTRLRGDDCIESWALVAALCLAEDRPANLYRRLVQRLRGKTVYGCRLVARNNLVVR